MTRKMIFLKLICVINFFEVYNALTGHNLALVIIGQNDDYHLKLAKYLKNNIIFQSANISMTVPQFFTHPQNFQNEAGWTIYPLLPSIRKNISDSIQWIVFAEDRTNIKLKLLIDILEKYDSKEDIWLGYTLTDREATIIHHFAFFKDPSIFKYPNLGSGFVMSVPLLERLVKKLSNQTYDQSNFHIDVSHEFAVFVTDNGKSNMMTHEEQFCTKQKENCAAFPEKFQACGEPEDTHIYAVKTFHKFHNNRVKVVLETWGQYTKDLLFFSDKEDTSIPTITLDVENTEQGHCAKTIEILRFLQKRLESQGTAQWIILVDDDTILSVSRISHLLTCFNLTVSPMMIGERYRFLSNGDGYDYLTGGAGIAINRKAVQILVQHCTCPKSDSPDDMILGACAKMLGISLVHFPYFHQARPTDYAPGYLDTMDAVSFHKHWMIDPILVYDEYFREDDKVFFTKMSYQPKKKDEF